MASRGSFSGQRGRGRGRGRGGGGGARGRGRGRGAAGATGAAGAAGAAGQSREPKPKTLQIQYKYHAPSELVWDPCKSTEPVAERVVTHLRQHRDVAGVVDAPMTKHKAFHGEDDVKYEPQMGVTTNGAAQFDGSGNPVLDLFFTAMVRGCDTKKVVQLMEAAWHADPKLTLQVLLNGRDCRGGKGEKAVVYPCMLWLRQHAPCTYALNLRRFLELGYYKDLVTLSMGLAPHTPGLFLKPSDAAAAKSKKASKPTETAGSADAGDTGVEAAEAKVLHYVAPAYNPSVDVCLNDIIELEVFAEDLRADLRRLGLMAEEKEESKEELNPEKTSEDWAMVDAILNSKPAQTSSKQTAMTLEEERAVKNAPAVAVEEPRIADADAGVVDAKESEEEHKARVLQRTANKKAKRVSVSLAGKWAPTEKGAADRHAALAKRLARLLFPHDGKQSLQKYRKAMGALRSHAVVVERLMCEGKWDEINFGAVPSRAHHLLKKAFQKHQPERYEEYKAKLATGKEKVNVAGLGPHELVATYLTKGQKEDAIVEAQWVTLVQQLQKAGKLKSSVSVVDVSGSMHGTPMEVAITLGLITSELTTGPFAHRVITFDSNPTWHHVQEGSLHSQVKAMARAPWGGSTNLQKTFDLILSHAKASRATQEDMPKTLFIYSDMQFDTACGGKTNFETMVSKFREAGYSIPQVVFWNLQGGGSGSKFPVTVNESGVALLSGFSAQLLKAFMDELEFTPMGVLRAIVEKYECEVDAAEEKQAKSKAAS